MTRQRVIHRHNDEENPSKRFPVCGMKRQDVIDDPAHFWSDTWDMVTCEDCLAQLPAPPPPQYAFPETEQAKRVHELMFQWWEEFVKKNADYQTSTGNVSENFGVMGQYMKLTDKIHKLRKPMHDAEILRQAEQLGADVDPDLYLAPFQFEGTEEILRDLIGHCFLTLDLLEQKRSEG